MASIDEARDERRSWRFLSEGCIEHDVEEARSWAKRIESGKGALFDMQRDAVLYYVHNLLDAIVMLSNQNDQLRRLNVEQKDKYTRKIQRLQDEVRDLRRYRVVA